ncbi:hypothetical protein P43SY_000393 [Pythium insidiosum]|uniref:WW domain-containing protein n=1 Tax=Pythium insidiosum TaxID=114742 RepID=A0AAD5M7Z7_PYTIN|nr:hypothetical protein P43SY_000393 [Pythium insidiosum]
MGKPRDHEHGDRDRRRKASHASELSGAYHSAVSYSSSSRRGSHKRSRLRFAPPLDAASMSQLASKTGFLRKQADNQPGKWTPYYFAIRPATYLYYYNSLDDDEPRAVIDLTFLQDVRFNRECMQRAIGGSEHCFRVTGRLPEEFRVGSDRSKFRPLYLDTESREDASEWMSAILNHRYGQSPDDDDDEREEMQKALEFADERVGAMRRQLQDARHAADAIWRKAHDCLARLRGDSEVDEQGPTSSRDLHSALEAVDAMLDQLCEEAELIQKKRIKLEDQMEQVRQQQQQQQEETARRRREETALNAAMKELQDRQYELDAQEAALNHRERQLEARDKHLQAREEELKMNQNPSKTHLTEDNSALAQRDYLGHQAGRSDNLHAPVSKPRSVSKTKSHGLSTTPGLPTGWVKYESKSYPGEFYYFNRALNQTTWDLPTVEEDPVKPIYLSGHNTDEAEDDAEEDDEQHEIGSLATTTMSYDRHSEDSQQRSEDSFHSESPIDDNDHSDSESPTPHATTMDSVMQNPVTSKGKGGWRTRFKLPKTKKKATGGPSISAVDEEEPLPELSPPGVSTFEHPDRAGNKGKSPAWKGKLKLPTKGFALRRGKSSRNLGSASPGHQEYECIELEDGRCQF